MMTKGEQLRAFREKQGLTMAQICEKCGISPHTWSVYENGLREPRVSVLEKVYAAFGIKEEDVFGGGKKGKAPVKKEKAKEQKAEEPAPAKEQKAEQAAPAQAEGELPQILVQSLMQDEVSLEEVIRKVQRVAPHAEKIYIKPSENRAYWTSGKESDWVWLW